jgi:hypothetical protein
MVQTTNQLIVGFNKHHRNMGFNKWDHDAISIYVLFGRMKMMIQQHVKPQKMDNVMMVLACLLGFNDGTRGLERWESVGSVMISTIEERSLMNHSQHMDTYGSPNQSHALSDMTWNVFDDVLHRFNVSHAHFDFVMGMTNPRIMKTA